MAHGHDHRDHGDHHGHEADRGIRGALRYLRWLPEMWRSDVNDAVVAMVDPQAGERVLDIGAGMGAGVMRAATSGASVIAVEPTPFMRLLLSVRRMVGRHRRAIDVVDGSAEALPVDDASVDAIWAVNTMHHWSDPERGASEIARVLRPGGRVVLVDEDFTDAGHPDHDRFGAAAGDAHDHGFAEVDADEMAERLTAAGLNGVEASRREVAGRPSIVVTAGAPGGAGP